MYSLVLPILIRLNKRTYKLNTRSFITTAPSSTREVIADDCQRRDSPRKAIILNEEKKRIERQDKTRERKKERQRTCP
jgi:hypothetical protein